MDHLTPLPTWLLVLALDVLIGVALTRRRRLSEPPDLRLEIGGVRAKTRCYQPSQKRIVAVLLSRPEMQNRLRSALGELTNRFIFTSTWADLLRVVDCESPDAIFADPLADPSGDPEHGLIKVAVVLHVPVILYTHLTPQLGDALLRLGRIGIRAIIVHRFDDEAARLVAAVDAVAPPPSGPPSRAA